MYYNKKMNELKNNVKPILRLKAVNSESKNTDSNSDTTDSVSTDDEIVEEESAVLKDSIENELTRTLEERDPWMARKEDGVTDV